MDSIFTTETNELLRVSSHDEAVIRQYPQYKFYCRVSPETPDQLIRSTLVDWPLSGEQAHVQSQRLGAYLLDALDHFVSIEPIGAN